MDAAELKPGAVIGGAFFTELVQAIVILLLGDIAKPIGKVLGSGQVHELVVNAGELQLLVGSPESPLFDGEASAGVWVGKEVGWTTSGGRPRNRVDGDGSAGRGAL